MTAQITEFVSRDKAGLRPPESVSYNIDPSRGGSTGHYAGGPQRVNSHSDCYRLWRGYQNWHMDNNNWVDVAYTGAFCDHGAAFAGRGANIRTAANGTDEGNDYWYAFVWIGGEGETPTRKALDAFEWWVVRMRKEGGAGLGVWPHSRHKNTACPGDPLRGHCRAIHNSKLEAQEDEVMANMPNWMKNPFRRLRDLGVYSKHTKWDTPVTSGELAVYLYRAGLTDMLEEVENKGTNLRGFVRYGVDVIRGHRGQDHP